MIDVAVDAGADAVKFQVFRAKTMYPNKKIEVKYLKNMGIKDDLYNIIKRMEVPYEWVEVLYNYSNSKGIIFMASPFDKEAVRILDPYVSIFKIASYEAMYGDLIDAVKATGKPLFISVGGCSEKEIDLIVKKSLNDYLDNTVLLHCIAKYPTPLNQVNLNVIPHLAQKYSIKVGFSDHTEHPLIAPMGAVALGAVVIEKHYTLSKNLPGPDHAFALEPDELKNMISSIRMVQQALKGQSKKKVLQKCEKELYYYKRCFYFKKDLPKGHKINKKDLKILRNTGSECNYFNPLELDMVLGKRLKKNIGADEIVVKEDLQ
ncbi:MAG: N-acetylneuraminate synthase family protein [Thermodesulfovibrionia bacterium]|nr:N-acetylneuraminate synthase family protein [Thermodesulfovibrionia bacterium]